MSSQLREAIAFTLRYCGLPWIVRNTLARTRCTILLYHDPTPEGLDRHLAYLAPRYRFITLDRLVDAIHSRDWSGIPARSVVVTLDDGHRGNVHLKPVFQRYGVTPTVYVVSRVVGTLRHFWFQHVGEACYPLMPLPNEERLRVLRESFGYDPSRDYEAASRQALSDEELTDLAGFAEIASHTCFHPILTTCSDPECAWEIEQSKRDLESRFDRECRNFSYPNGDYTEREIELVRAAGYRSARTVDVGWNSVRSDPFRLRVMGVTDDASVNILAAQTTGLTVYLRQLVAGSFSGRHRTILPSPRGA